MPVLDLHIYVWTELCADWMAGEGRVNLRYWPDQLHDAATWSRSYALTISVVVDPDERSFPVILMGSLLFIGEVG